MSTNNFLDPSLHDQDAPDVAKNQQPPPQQQQQQQQQQPGGAMDVYYHPPMPHHQPQQQPQPPVQQQQQQQQQPSQPQVMNVPAAVQEGAMPPQSDVDEFLRKKRKAREHKACYPCRQRKVKCDLSRPCQTCRDRDHPELCSYHPPNKRQNGEPPAPPVPVPRSDDGFAAPGVAAPAAGTVTLSQAQFDMLCNKLNSLEESMAEMRNEFSRSSESHATNTNHDPALFNSRDNQKALNCAILSNGQTSNGDGEAPRFQRHAATHGIHAKNELGQTVHFGAGSIPAFLIALRNGGNTDLTEAQEVLGKSILPMFGLDNESATYPFVDLWGLPHGSLQRAQELAKALPTDSQSLSFFRYYRDMAYVIYPGLAQLELFEEELNQFLVVRAANDAAGEGVSEQQVHGQDFHWLGLLFAVLASGAQSSQMQRKERELTSQVYICCAMECLRIVNFLSQVKLETVQTLLIIQNVLTNNMNAATAWALHGLTIRLAQGLGIHQPCPPSIPTELVYPRSKLWWGVVWQDSLLSIIYDRASGPTTATKTTMPMPMRYGPISEYHKTMYPLVQVGLEIVRDREKINDMTPHEMHEKIAAHRETISQLMRDSADYLRDSRKCTSPQQTLEHWALYLHTSYSLSELCRPAISTRYASREMVAAYKPLCVENLINTVEAFLGLNNITAYARQSWAAIHRGLGSALLLGILGEHNKNERARHLLARFINAIHDITTNIDPNEVAAPLQRGISALNRLGISEVPGGQQRYEEHLNDAGVAIGADGSLKLEHNSAMYTTPNSDMTGSGDEQSPYSVLNTILWGATNPLVQQTHGNGHLPVPPM